MVTIVMKAISAILLSATAATLGSPVYQLHEWGTFTTVSGSDGVLLPGLEREEESLPPFVHSHFGLENGQIQNPAEFQRILQQHGTFGFPQPGNFKGTGRRPLAGVTVKMETPVIYFHSEETVAFPVKVNVGFNGGTISQWYPDRSGGEILPEPKPSASPSLNPTPVAAWTLDFTKPFKGAIEWQVDVLPPADSRALSLFKPGDNLGWLRTRQPSANAVRTAKGETEGYLFYRGLGGFDPGLKTTVDAKETLRLANRTGGRIPFVVVFDRPNHGNLRWSAYPNGLEAGAELEVADAALKVEPSGFPQSLYETMRTGLAGCGLTDLEARSMVETWWHSYFEAPGLRVFWVLPQETTDHLLPLQASPPPAHIVRVIVGRSEVLRPRRENEWFAASRETGEAAAPWNQLVTADRFGLAISNRVKAMNGPIPPVP